MFPQRHLAAVRQRVARECLVGLVQRDERVAAVGLLHPLHQLHRVFKHLVDSLYKSFVLALFVIRVNGITF